MLRNENSVSVGFHKGSWKEWFRDMQVVYYGKYEGIKLSCWENSPTLEQKGNR